MSGTRGACAKRLATGLTCECSEYYVPLSGALCGCCEHHQNFHAPLVNSNVGHTVDFD